MDIHEYQAKEIFRSYGIPVPEGRVAHSGNQALAVAEELGGDGWAQAHMSKPLISFVAGATAPQGRRMGHAGAIISGESDTAQAKKKRLAELGVYVVQNAAEIGKTIKDQIDS